DRVLPRESPSPDRGREDARRRVRRRGAHAHGRPGTPPRSGAKDGEYRAIPRVRPERGGRGGHPCPAPGATHRPLGPAVPCRGRAGPHDLPSTTDVGTGHGPDDRARTGDLHGATTPLRGLPDQGAVPVLL